MSDFKWNAKRNEAAILLAEGQTQGSAARAVGVNPKTLYRWLQHPEFSSEVDRLSLMIGIASRAERVRIAKRLVQQRIREDMTIMSDRDLLDWLKYVQGETDGLKLDLASIAEAATSMASS